MYSEVKSISLSTYDGEAGNLQPVNSTERVSRMQESNVVDVLYSEILDIYDHFSSSRISLSLIQFLRH